MRIKLLILGVVLSLVGCFESEAGPSENELKNYLQKRLPSHVKITDFDIVVSENSGTKLDPIIKSKVKGKAILVEPLYKVKKYILNKDVLVKSAKKNDRMNLSGRTSSTLRGEKWSIRFTQLEAKPDFKGRPLSQWRKDSFVMSGSKEEKALIAKSKEEAKKWKKQMKKLRASVVGKWVSKKPIIERNNKFVSIGSTVNTGNREQLMYSINFPNDTNLKGIASATLFGTKNRNKPITIKLSYEITDIGEVRIKEIENKCIYDWCAGGGYKWTLTVYSNPVMLSAASSDRRYNMKLYKK